MSQSAKPDYQVIGSKGYVLGIQTWVLSASVHKDTWTHFWFRKKSQAEKNILIPNNPQWRVR